MAAAVPFIPLILSAASTGVAVVGAIKQGEASKRAASLERQQIEQRGQREELAAAEAEADRKRRLGATLSTQRALFSSRGISLGSGTVQQIQREDILEAERESRIAGDNLDLSRSQDLLSKQQAKQRGDAGFAGAIVKGSTSLLDFGVTAADSGVFSKKGTS